MTGLVQGFDLFHFYRFLLALLVCVYGTVRLVQFIWHWHGADVDGWLGASWLRRYAIVLLLRLRFRAFAYELLVIGGLAGVLVLLLRLHWC